MHRSLTILSLTVVALTAPDHEAAVRAAEVTATVYVGRHFEVRDHDQPVKYVFNENDRVARVTGSFSSGERIQRLRLHPGWNLTSLAVTATNLVGQLEKFINDPAPLISALYRWRPTTGDFAGVSVGQNIEAGTVLWMRAETSAVVPVVGTYSDPAPQRFGAGGGYVATPGLESWSPRLPVGVTTWRFDAATGKWLASFTGELDSVGDLPPNLAPGDAIFVYASEAVELAQPEAADRFLFYHTDHLGSAAALSDVSGNSVEETAHHPFGGVRHQHRARTAPAHYGFTQKERDRESGLHYFEARYVVSPLGRFSSFDPLLQNFEALEGGELRKLLVEPARLNPFAYALNNPMRYVDPDGRESREARPRPRARATPPRPTQLVRPPQPRQPDHPRRLGPELTLRLGPPTKRPGELPADSFSVNRRNNPNPTTAGSAGREASVPGFTDIQVTRLTDDASTSLFMSHQEGKTFKSVQLIVPGKEGKDVLLHMEDVMISSYSVSGHTGELHENLTFNAGKISFKAPNQPTPAPVSREQWNLGQERGQ